MRVAGFGLCVAGCVFCVGSFDVGSFNAVTFDANAQRIIWDGTGANPYPYFLAGADAFVVTADSVNMAGEACATGKPVYIFMPEGGRAKFHAFHHALEQTGATRLLPERLEALDTWRYDPIHSAGRIAAEIIRRARMRAVPA